MPCVTLPTVTAPTLPDPISIGITLPSTTFNLELCCKIPPVSIPVGPPPIPALILNSAVIAALNTYIDQAVTYINSLSIPCPIE